jgi:hypothetical protein
MGLSYRCLFDFFEFYGDLCRFYGDYSLLSQYFDVFDLNDLAFLFFINYSTKYQYFTIKKAFVLQGFLCQRLFIFLFFLICYMNIKKIKLKWT